MMVIHGETTPEKNHAKEGRQDLNEAEIILKVIVIGEQLREVETCQMVIFKVQMLQTIGTITNLMDEEEEKETEVVWVDEEEAEE